MKDKEPKSATVRRGKKKRRKDTNTKAGKPGKITLKALPAPERAHDPALLDASRIQWQHGDWAGLAQIDVQLISNHPDRARLALVVSAAHAQMGDVTQARIFADHALDWGCSRVVAAQVLISSAHNSLGRLATCLEDAAALEHFTSALQIVEPKADLPLLARSRQIRETTRLGLLPEAADLLAIDLAEVQKAPHDHAARVAMLDTRLMQLKHELSISLARDQIYRGADDSTDTLSPSPDDLRRRSVSQLGQDLWVLEKLNFKRDGYFVEFGATDGVLLSNTLLLERDFGWRGLCAEPNPDFFLQLRQNRKCKALDTCIGTRTGDVVDFILADEYGGIADYADLDHLGAHRKAFAAAGKSVQMTTQSLHDFLTRNGAPRDIDYLSIDTEGNEYDILSTFPFKEWNIRLITVEHNFSEQRDSIRQLLAQHGYIRTESQWDDWYELSEGTT